MSRNQPGARAPFRRQLAELDPYATPATGQPAGQWPGNYPDQSRAPQPPFGQQPGYGQQGGYDQQGQPMHPQQQGQGFYFPQAAEGEANYGYNANAAGQAPAFDRFPPPPAPGYPQQPQDARGYDLGSYMPATNQGYAPADPTHEGQPPFGPQHHAYGDHDNEYDEPVHEEDEEPRRGRRGLLIVGALVGAIGLGGALAYTYKTFIAPSPGRAPLVRATDPAANKVKPIIPGGKEFAHTDKKLLNRVGDDGTQRTETEAQDDRVSDDPNAPRKVRIIPINPGGQAQAGPVSVGTPPAKGPATSVPIAGIMLDNMGGPSQAARAQPLPPPQATPPVRPVQAAAAPAAAPTQPPVKMASVAAPIVPPAAPAAEPVAPKKVVAVAPKQPVPKKEAAVAATPASISTSGTNGFVAVLSSQKSRMDALKAFADLQQKYGDVLGTRTPDVQEANLGEKGVWFRAVVGPPGSRDAASGICTQLKSAGYSGCWVAAY